MTLTFPEVLFVAGWMFAMGWLCHAEIVRERQRRRRAIRTLTPLKKETPR